MADVTFASFTLEASPAVTDFLVGYRTAIAGGERRTTLSSLNSLFQANITAGLTAARVLISGATSNLAASDLSYSTPTLTVPASFGITGAGSLAFTAGGSNQDITLTPSGTGNLLMRVSGSTVARANGTNFAFELTNGLNAAPATDASAVRIFRTGGSGGAYPYNQAGHIVLQSRDTTNRDVVFAGANGVTHIASADGKFYYGSDTTAGYILGSGGGLAVTAQGSNQNITLTPSGTGTISATGSIEITGTSVNRQIQIDTTTSGTATVTIAGYSTNTNPIGTGGGGIFLMRNKDATSGNVCYFSMLDSASSNVARFGGVIEDHTNHVGSIFFATRLSGGSLTRAVNITKEGTLSPGASNQTVPAWGVTGIQYAGQARTYTDSTSSGTVATAVANSFAVPTFAASSATTFTNAANLYIAGDVANGTNVTLTNSYGLWNVGKTRLDGNIVLNGTAVTVPDAWTVTSAGSISLAAGGTNKSINITPIGTGTLNITGNTLINSTGGTLGLTPRLRVDSPNTNTGPAIAMVADSIGRGFYLYEAGYVASSAGANVNLNIVTGVGASLGVGTGGGASGGTFQFLSPTIVAHLNTTDATIGGAGSITSAGGIYATKKIVSGTSVFDGTTANLAITGGAGNMTITAGTGNSRTLTLQTTTSGGTATNALTLNATQDATFAARIIQTNPITPANASATGTVGTMAWDTGFIYICTATNTWKRVAIATW